MYINPRKHILSETILITAVIRLLTAIASGTARLLMRRAGVLPDMVDDLTYTVQNFFSLVNLVLSASVFVYALFRITHFIGVVPEEERREIARLQEEVFGKKNTVLPAETVRKLLEVWCVILVGAQAMYDFMNIIYRQFAVNLAGIVLSSGSEGAQGAYVSLYNFTHCFKYQGMLIALLLGVLMTAIFLSDPFLMIIAVGIAALFIVCSMGMEMYTLSVLGHSFGIVWTSVLFHFIETVGMITMALYLRLRYRGV